MTVLFTDDFETGDFSKWVATVGTAAITSASKYQGNYAAWTGGSVAGQNHLLQVDKRLKVT